MYTKNTERRQQMFQLIEQWSQSSLSQKQFCQDNHIKPAMFNYWLRRYRQQQDTSSSAFLQVKVNTPQGDHRFTLEYPNGVRLMVPGDISPSTLGRLINLR